MILATYLLSSPINPRQFEDSYLFEEGSEDCSYNLMVLFNAPRDGEFRVSMTHFWGVIFFHRSGQMDIEVDNLNEEILLDMLQEISDAFFVSMKLYQPLHLNGLPRSVQPGGNERRVS